MQTTFIEFIKAAPLAALLSLGVAGMTQAQTPISTIQGAGHVSPFVNQRVGKLRHNRNVSVRLALVQACCQCHNAVKVRSKNASRDYLDRRRID